MTDERTNKVIDKLGTFVANLPDYLMYLGAALLVLDAFLATAFGRSFLGAGDLRLSVIVFTVVAFVAIVNRKLNGLQRELDRLSTTNDNRLDLISEGDRPQFTDLLMTCDDIRVLTLSGTKTIPLGDERVIEALMGRSKRAKVVLLLADPTSSAIRMRYHSDEPASHESGLSGIERRLIQLHSILEQIKPEHRSTIDVRVFRCYPTISILWADNDFYSTSYGFHLRGSDCPQIYSRVGNEHAEFLVKHFNRVYENSIPLAEWIKANHHSHPGHS